MNTLFSRGAWPAVVLSVLLPIPGSSSTPQRAVVIEDFESGTVVLRSYPDQDHDPDAWEVTSDDPFGGAYGLRLHGNTWKIQDITPRQITGATVWRVAVQAERLGEMQGFGVSDGVNELLYSFAGDQLPQNPKWWTVYQGAFPLQSWYGYLLPIGADWLATHGYLPTVGELIYVNDDDSGSTGITRFDEIVDVTDDLPVPPQVLIQHTQERSTRIARDLYRVGVQFHSEVFDPDSPEHQYAWDFGDSTTSHHPDPYHDFTVEAGHTYTVSLTVVDSDGLAGGDTCQVRVEPGEGDLPIRVNFVGDIMTGRRYEDSGGIIESQGVEAIFAPTRPIFGDAADVSVCNLEVPYTDRGQPHPTKSVVFRARPENIAGIVYAGVDVADLGNNHIIDYGEPGMLQTQALLDSLGIPHSGAGTNAHFALQPTYWTEQGVRIGFLGQCNRTGRQWNYQPFLDAGYNKPGFGYLLPRNLEGPLAATRELADVVVLQLHSGDEYETAPPPGARPSDARPRVEAAEIGPDDPDFDFRIEPTPGERELRRMAIDLGADVVINHHPHVLQRFESYQGKLIAHSLGNFVFDLYYPETMPTIVLTLEMAKHGIVGYEITPAWIDDYIPRPATGGLGKEILDRLADYSRPMGAVVAVDGEESRARIHLSRGHMDSTVVAVDSTVILVDVDGWWTSPPIAVSGRGNLSSIVEATGDGLTTYEVRWGRDLLWHGGFEEEGATFWEVSPSDAWLDPTMAHGGERALALRRAVGDGSLGIDLEKHLPCHPDRSHTVTGFVRGDNAADAVVSARFFASRYTSSPLTSEDAGPPITGTGDWAHRWRDVDTPSGGIYFEVRCRNAGPDAGVGHAWFDDLAFVEWEPWREGEPGLVIPSPNNYRFVQIRTPDPGVGPVTVRRQETSYVPLTIAVEEGPVTASSPVLLRAAPNPFNPHTRIQLVLPPSGETLPVSVAVFDVRGRRLADLLQGSFPGGAVHQLSWDGTDQRGGALPSGVYFLRADVGSQIGRRKLLLLR